MAMHAAWRRQVNCRGGLPPAVIVEAVRAGGILPMTIHACANISTS